MQMEIVVPKNLRKKRKKRKKIKLGKKVQKRIRGA
jgi:hypothetical protein